MRVFSVIGHGNLDRMKLIAEILVRRHHSVGLIRDNGNVIERETDGFNNPGNPFDFTAGYFHNARDKGDEGYVSWAGKKSFNELLRICDSDFTMVENNLQEEIPKLLIATSLSQIEEKLQTLQQGKETLFAILVPIREGGKDYQGIPIFSIGEEEALVDRIEDVVFEKLPGFTPKCCGACGKSCGQLCRDILAGISKRSDCKISSDHVQLFINGREVEMVDFVRRILKNAVNGIVSELDGYHEKARIEVKMGPANCLTVISD